MKTILKPSQVMRLTKAGKLPHKINGGKPFCRKCRKSSNTQTESPMFWENGMYIWCRFCKQQTLALPIFPECVGYPKGFEIDLSGERKTYPMVLK